MGNALNYSAPVATVFSLKMSATLGKATARFARPGQRKRLALNPSVDTTKPATDRHFKADHHDGGLRLVIRSA